MGEQKGILLLTEDIEYKEVLKEPWRYLNEIWTGLTYQKNIYLAITFSEDSHPSKKVLYSKYGVSTACSQ